MDADIAMKKQQALLPEINPKKRRWKHSAAVAQRALQHYEEKYGRAPYDLLNTRLLTKEEEDQELDELFESVVEEIEER